MANPENDIIISETDEETIEKTVILQRCEKHDILFMPSEGCPECEKEKKAGD